MSRKCHKWCHVNITTEVMQFKKSKYVVQRRYGSCNLLQVL